ncbi:DeoR-family transcriptional regulator [Serratia fonticola AU-P3(3)]|nr:DeoR-family transcriptional regulator [Serratia fonticola AU-P3(3)]
MLRGISPDIAFVSCNSWSIEKGVTTPTEEKAGLKQDPMANARQRCCWQIAVNTYDVSV